MIRFAAIAIIAVGSLAGCYPTSSPVSPLIAPTVDGNGCDGDGCPTPSVPPTTTPPVDGNGCDGNGCPPPVDPCANGTSGN